MGCSFFNKVAIVPSWCTHKVEEGEKRLAVPLLTRFANGYYTH
ncbi:MULTISPECIES: hypothetical protein [Pectobacterium]|uniref:Uncharacterized protein n=1 Tax=Pectobacterium jejuense TaxID=2974022 RepID=A0ABW8GTA3_9GAMM|nr:MULTISPECIES: hypothetical protein [Pectobacterium]MCY9846539.1 hypothetical protein [Pectobacterium jejuense]